MEGRRRNGVFAGIAGVVFLLLFSTACQGTLMTDVRGKTVPPEHHIPLADSGSSQWEARDLTVNYRYRIEPGNFAVTGVVMLADSIKYNFLVIRYFHLDILFVDSEGRILAMTGLVSTGSRRSDDPISFNARIPIPRGASAIAFSYRGEALDTDHGGVGSPTYFWHYPIR
jgi:hypothetical protein